MLQQYVPPITNRELRWILMTPLILLITLLPITIVQATDHEQLPEYQHYWHQWRGPTSNGVAPHSNTPPLKWSEEQNIRWKVEMSVPGHARPPPPP